MDHFDEAEGFLAEAKDAYNSAINAKDDAESGIFLTRASYLLSLTNAHSVLAQIQAQRQGFSHVGKMADVVERDVNRKVVNKESSKGDTE